MSTARRNRLVRQFFQTMPRTVQVALCAGVFFCFAPIGLLQEAMTLTIAPWWVVMTITLFSGGIAVAYVWTLIARPRWFPVPVALHLVIAVGLGRIMPETVPPTVLDAAGIEALSTRMTVLAILTILSMMSAYTAFVFVIRREGLRFSDAHAEIRLAREIHTSLVPDIAGQRDGLTWVGRSRPSGDVGGDLADVVDHPRGWSATVADVSGHGVAAGVLMGMFKTAFRASLDDARDVADVVTRINRVIGPLSQAHMFITAACLREVAPGRLEYVLAGHPPVLHIVKATGTSAWVGESQLALALMEGTVYTSGEVLLAPGDVLVITTDGLIEVFDRADRELGLDGLKAAATAAALTGSLRDVEQAIFAACAAHGAQLDDQTALLIQRSN